MTLTPQQQLACEARQIQQWLCRNQGLEMAVLIALFAQIAGVTVTCASLEALAAQFNCLPRQTQLPALIYLATQIVQNGAAPPLVDSIPYPGPPTVAPGVVVNNVALLSVVVDSNYQQWQYGPLGWQ
jgi:hypothetical protein